MSIRQLFRWRWRKCKSLIDIDMRRVWKSLKSLSDCFTHIYYSYFIWRESIIDVVWHWVFLIKQSFHPLLRDMRYNMANEVRKACTYPANACSRGITVDYCVFSSMQHQMDFYQLIASLFSRIPSAIIFVPSLF